MVNDIFDTIIKKEYNQLTTNELIELAEFCANEAEFSAIKQTLLHTKTIAEGPKLIPKVATKKQLDQLFAATYSNNSQKGIFFRNPYVSIAAAVAIGFAIWLTVPTNAPQGNIQTAKNENPTQHRTPSTPTAEPMSTSSTPDQLNAGATSVEKTVTISQNAGGSNKQMNALDALPVKEKNSTYSAPIVQESTSSSDNSVVPSLPPVEDVLSKSLTKVSTPASSVKDISVEASKSLYKKATVTSMHVPDQLKTMQYLVPRY